jgi:hypothetical protein
MISLESVGELANCALLIATVRLVNNGSADTPIWEVEYPAFEFPAGSDLSKEPDEQVLIILMNDLKALVGKAPGEPVRLNAQAQQEIKYRLQTGEPETAIASAYRVDLDTVRWLARAVRL